MEYIKNRFYEKAMKSMADLQKLRKDHGDVVLGQVTIDQVLSGMKGIPALLTETSKLDANEGIRFRGFSLPELQEKLPKMDEAGEPLPEGLFYLMMIGEIPEKEDVINISKDWATRAHVPQHVFDVIDALPKNSRPMTQFSTAILSMAYDSVFQKAYHDIDCPSSAHCSLYLSPYISQRKSHRTKSEFGLGWKPGSHDGARFG